MRVASQPRKDKSRMPRILNEIELRLVSQMCITRRRAARLGSVDSDRDLWEVLSLRSQTIAASEES